MARLAFPSFPADEALAELLVATAAPRSLLLFYEWEASSPEMETTPSVEETDGAI